MGLKATVYCDCHEKGVTRQPPPQPELVYVDESGQVSLRWDQPNADQFAFDEWLAGACEHGPSGELVSYHLGNVALTSYLRQLLKATSDSFPTLLGKILYDGTHAGDFISGIEVEELRGELDLLHEVHDGDATQEKLVRELEKQLTALVEASKAVKKPIAF